VLGLSPFAGNLTIRASIRFRGVNLTLETKETRVGEGDMYKSLFVNSFVSTTLTRVRERWMRFGVANRLGERRYGSVIPNVFDLITSLPTCSLR